MGASGPRPWPDAVTAGESARSESQRAERAADRLRRLADVEQRRARDFGQGAVGESRTAALLGSLSSFGFHMLHDRRWPGSSSANIDHLVVGPSGVFVIDTKSWSGEVTVDEQGLWQGQACRDDVLESVQRLADLVRDGLTGLGLPPAGVRPVIALDDRDLRCVVARGVWVVGAEILPRQLLGHAKNLTQREAERVLRSLMDLFPPAVDSIHVQPDAPLPVAATRPPSPAKPPSDALFDRADLEADALTAAMQAPLEDWMIFLHPRQAEFARRRFNGPALLRGSAGTGKTVVALHRMAYLAERHSSRVLFLSFVRTLPTVQEAAYRRLSPHTVDRVEFASLHGWAGRMLASRGHQLTIRREAVERAYQEAWTAVGQNSVLDRPSTWTYWSEEVKQVIRGRRISCLDDYQALARTGRGSRLGPIQREMVWRLKEQYENNPRASGLMDWDDLLAAALASVVDEPLAEPYGFVVVDEVQDLTRTGVELVSRAVADGPDSLLLVGDSRQAVFAGGVSPRQAGVNVTGRSTVLTVNYRNTAEILDFAAPLVAEADDLLGDGERIDADCEVVRHGLAPLVSQATRRRDVEVALTSCLRRTRDAERASWGGMAVLCSRVRDVRHYQGLLVSQDIPTVALEQWSGDPIDAVKVGTIKRAKGLEFLFVFLPEVDSSVLPGRTPPVDEVDRERLARSRRELYVAATRARDGLWVGLIGPARHEPEAMTVSVERRMAQVITEGAPSSAGDAIADDVYSLVRHDLQADVYGGPASFVQPGWVTRGLVAVLCDGCNWPLYAFCRTLDPHREPVKEWALVCRRCRTAREPAALPEGLQRSLRNVANA